MKVALGHAGYISISTTQAGNAELHAADLNKESDDCVEFYMTPERARTLHEELGEWLKEFGHRKGTEARL